MKIAESKPAATSANKNSTFFTKESERVFFNQSINENPFFSKSKFNGAQIQPKLSIGQPNDPYEQEADAMADKVVQRKPIFESNALPPEEETVQRKCAACEQEEKFQKKEGNASEATASPSIESSLAASRGSGNPLPAATREQMESSFGADFSDVRIHNDSSAVQMNKDLNAQAFTHGNDIFFNQGKFNLSGRDGHHLLAHELTHVLQQKGFPEKEEKYPMLKSIHGKFLQLQAERNHLRASAKKISQTTLSIQAEGLFNLSPSAVISKYFNISMPADPIAAIEALLGVLEHQYVKPVLSILPGYTSTVLTLRLALNTYKLIKYILDHKEQIIAEIKAYIEEKLNQVEPVAKAKLEELFGFWDSRHFKAIWGTYMLPMLVHLKDNWWETIKETLWEQIWPFEGITTLTESDPEKRKGLGKDLFEMKEHIAHGFTELKSGNFSKFADRILLLEKGMVGLVNRFYGWAAIIIIASETLIGAGISGVFSGGTLSGAGAAAGFGAGLATAGSVGEVLLIATMAIDAAVLLKSLFSLHPVDSMLVNEQKMKDNNEYYKQIAQSTISLTLMGLLLALAHVGAKITEAFLSRLVKYLPKNIQEIFENIKLGLKGEKPGAKEKEPVEVRENPPDLDPEFAQLREGIKKPENIKQVSDPQMMKDYDVEVRVGDHVYRRNKSKGTWCRFSDPVCGFKLEDVNTKVDEALKINTPKQVGVGEVLSVPYGGEGRGMTRAQVIEVNDQFVVVKYKSKAQKGGDVKHSIAKEKFNEQLKNGEIIRWTQERERLMRSRPEYREGLVDEVWNSAKQPDGKVYDPNTKQELNWDKTKNRWDQWHMGHKPGKEYQKLVDDYVNEKISWDEFIKEYNNPANYRPEHPLENISHKHEAK